MRITGGVNRNREVRVPSGARPTGGRVREALFSIWSLRLRGARFLDLFAGSGAVGLEAVSRGAGEAVFVERPGRNVRILQENCRKLGAERSKVVIYELPNRTGGDGTLREPRPGSGGELVSLIGGRFEFVFADPPYAFDGWESLLAIIERVLAPGGETALEHSSRVEPPANVGSLLAGSTRLYGESGLTFYARTSDD